MLLGASSTPPPSQSTLNLKVLSETSVAAFWFSQPYSCWYQWHCTEKSPRNQNGSHFIPALFWRGDFPWKHSQGEVPSLRQCQLKQAMPLPLCGVRSLIQGYFQLCTVLFSTHRVTSESSKSSHVPLIMQACTAIHQNLLELRKS